MRYATLIAVLALAPTAAFAQGTPADYARAAGLRGANHPAGRGNDPTAPHGDHKRFDFFVQHLLGVTPPPWNRPATTTTSDGARPGR
jgi:hypothetical protein